MGPPLSFNMILVILLSRLENPVWICLQLNLDEVYWLVRSLKYLNVNHIVDRIKA